jgi:hypothetical protein
MNLVFQTEQGKALALLRACRETASLSRRREPAGKPYEVVEPGSGEGETRIRGPSELIHEPEQGDLRCRSWYPSGNKRASRDISGPARAILEAGPALLRSLKKPWNLSRGGERRAWGPKTEGPTPPVTSPTP